MSILPFHFLSRSDLAKLGRNVGAMVGGTLGGPARRIVHIVHITDIVRAARQRRRQ